MKNTAIINLISTFALTYITTNKTKGLYEHYRLGKTSMVYHNHTWVSIVSSDNIFNSVHFHSESNYPY